MAEDHSTLETAPKLVFICHTCGLIDKRRSPTLRFCSRACTADYHPGILKPKECSICHEPFIPDSRSIKKCQTCRERKKEIKEDPRCFGCGISFIPSYPGQVYCCSSCRPPIRKIAERRSTGTPKGRYVYAWFKNEEVMPFYIGKGIDSRAWERHIDPVNGKLQYCEQVRISATSFEIRIIRDNLTEEGAALIEATLISFLSGCGYVLSNQMEGRGHREVPPLTLDVD